MARRKINKKDYLRALLTDTSPGDIPIIFSNDGFYLNCVQYIYKESSHYKEIIDKIFDKLFRMERLSETKPYKFDISKDKYSTRELSLLHPKAQLDICRFYRDYAVTLVYLCNQSPSSIRAPKKISSSYYSTENDPSEKYKSFDIEIVKDEHGSKYLSNYFGYYGYKMLYRFFDSKRYLNLEKKYPMMCLADIANCFPSIYTHSISWSVKTKEYSKKYKDFHNQFSAIFDKLMQRSNNNETNGITVGSETSRIFSEIILQKIDTNIINELKEVSDYVFGKEYEFYRYVDDYIIFAETDSVRQSVIEAVSQNLQDYNLYLNYSKIHEYGRPFSTKKSSLISAIKNEIDLLEVQIVAEKIIEGRKKQLVNNITNPIKLSTSFINKIKTHCALTSSDYQDISNYIISVITNLALKIRARYWIPKDQSPDTINLNYRKALSCLIEVLFFFYTVQNSVSSSYKLAKVIVICDEFINSHMPEFSDYYRTSIMENINELNFTNNRKSPRTNYASIETLNIVLATSGFGSKYHIDSDLLKGFIDSNISYFEIISILFYVKNTAQYSSIVKLLEKKIVQKINLVENPCDCSECIHLILDSLSCPYISDSTKITLLSVLQKALSLGKLSKSDRISFIKDLSSTYWFVNWNKMDLVKLIRKKSLIGSY